MMSDQLEEFLAPQVEAPQQEVKPEPEVPETPTGEEEVKTPPVEQEQVQQPDIEGIKAAMLAERRRRQEVEAELERAKTEQKPDFWEDPEGRLAEVEERFNQRLVAERLNLSESFARDKYEDFQEKLDVFAEMVRDNPVLYQTMLQQVNPAEYAYKTASQAQKMRELGDPVAYEAKLKAEIEAKVRAEKEAEFEKRLEEELKKRSALPGSLADARGAAGTKTVEWGGPTALKDILK